MFDRVLIGPMSQQKTSDTSTRQIFTIGQIQTTYQKRYLTFDNFIWIMMFYYLLLVIRQKRRILEWM